jgi:diguanylate cyclase (GGDEF)-like protein
VNKDELFAPIRRITARSLFSAIICNASLLLLTNILLIQIAKYRIKHIERRKDLYKEYAYRDALTGAYSRLYLERWIYTHSYKSKFIHENICIAMLDIYNYKLINDSYGHYIGDKVLQYLVKYINETIKDEDFVVRFGGDEFVIVLQNTRLDEAKSLLSEISDKLCNIKEMQLGISISYGIEQVSSYDGVFDGIERADEKMYISKKKYKQTLLYNQFV